MTTQPHGIIPPMTTPFTKAGEPYEKGLRELVDFQVEGGSEGLFINGTYGSGPLMSVDQRKQVAEIVLDQAAGRIDVINHVGTTNTADSVALAQHSQEIGIEVVAAISPYYMGHKEPTVVNFFKTMVESVDIDVYVYNNPKCSGVQISPSFLRHLYEVGVAGVKDSGFGFIEFVDFVLEMADVPDFTIVVGTEGIALPAWMSGAKGCVSGLANCFPEIMRRLWDLFKAGKYEEAAAVQLDVNRARNYLHIPASTNAACYTMLLERGVDVGYPKAPVMFPEQDKADKMIAAYKSMGLL